jgi:hypothetical protein
MSFVTSCFLLRCAGLLAPWNTNDVFSPSCPRSHFTPARRANTERIRNVLLGSQNVSRQAITCTSIQYSYQKDIPTYLVLILKSKDTRA